MGKWDVRISRRASLRILANGTAGATLAAALPYRGQQASAQQQPRRYLFVIAAAGGGSLIDSFLPQTQGPGSYTADQIIQPTGSNIRTVIPLQNSIQGAIPLGNGYSLGTFLSKHVMDTVVVTSEVSSVNHVVASQRAMNGDGIQGGLTITEAVANQYGMGLSLPNLSFASDGYGISSTKAPPLARNIPIADPLMFSFVTHGYKGITSAPNAMAMSTARQLRRELERVSRWGTKHGGKEMVKAYLENRENLMLSLEKGNVISKMMLLNSPELASFNFEISPDAIKVAEKFPNLMSDPLEAKVASAFLAVRNGITATVTVEPSSEPLITPEGSPNAPILFDWSHVDHRGAQNAHWSYIMKSVDALIDLLKSEDVEGDPAKGKMWDHSLIYIATEFGRDKVATGGSGHHLNNGNILISPLLKGNAVYGGVNPTTGLTYGFDPATGQPDPGRTMTERDIYSLIAHAMGIEFAGRHDMPALVKA